MLEGKTPSELIDLVRQLVGEVTRLRGENEKLSHAVARLRLHDNQALKDELGRLKHLPPRPPQKPSGMEKATDEPERGDQGEAAKRRPGSPSFPSTARKRFRSPPRRARAISGFEDIIVQDLMVKAETTRYRRERWETPDGKGLIAPLAYKRGEPRVCSMVRAPTPEDEDRRRLCRERKTLIAERVEHVNRIKGLLLLTGNIELRAAAPRSTPTARGLEDGRPPFSADASQNPDQPRTRSARTADRSNQVGGG